MEAYRRHQNMTHVNQTPSELRLNDNFDRVGQAAPRAATRHYGHGLAESRLKPDPEGVRANRDSSAVDVDEDRRHAKMLFCQASVLQVESDTSPVPRRASGGDGDADLKLIRLLSMVPLDIDVAADCVSRNRRPHPGRVARCDERREHVHEGAAFERHSGSVDGAPGRFLTYHFRPPVASVFELDDKDGGTSPELSIRDNSRVSNNYVPTSGRGQCWQRCERLPRGLGRTETRNWRRGWFGRRRDDGRWSRGGCGRRRRLQGRCDAGAGAEGTTDRY